ncbi:MAG: short chain dehydrogenase [Chthonomonadaceae bacterium]|nr:short chain dehydrogenase [Chthonomonadaceae bacterium]
MRDFTDRVALVTGASRGIGAATARLLAKGGADVVINYRSKGPRAEQVAEAIRALGHRALPVQADLTDEADMQQMIEAVRAEFGRVNLLFLNASGGMEKDKEAGYALQLNRDAQVRALDLTLPLMPDGSRIVFVTSHMAHFHGEKYVWPDYEVVAASKKAGEDALRARIPELDARNIRLIVVSGDLIEGTITAKLLERASPGRTEARRQKAGSVPTVEEFAAAVVDAAADASLDSGTTLFVGDTEV